MNIKKILQDKKKELEKDIKELENVIRHSSSRVADAIEVKIWKLEAKLSLINELLNKFKEKNE